MQLAEEATAGGNQRCAFSLTEGRDGLSAVACGLWTERAHAEGGFRTGPPIRARVHSGVLSILRRRGEELACVQRQRARVDRRVFPDVLRRYLESETHANRSEIHAKSMRSRFRLAAHRPVCTAGALACGCQISVGVS